MPRRYDDRGFVIVRDNSDRCRDCAGDDQNIAYQDLDEGGRVTSVYTLCKTCDDDRQEGQSNAGS